jgi:hypothetical protein
MVMMEHVELLTRAALQAGGDYQDREGEACQHEDDVEKLQRIEKQSSSNMVLPHFLLINGR